MMEKNTSVYERYKTEIYRIGWRVQYRAKKIRNRENPIFEHSNDAGSDFTPSAVDRVVVRELIDTLPSQGKTIIDKLYFQDLSEAEVAQQLQISQQAVNKWKRKMIQTLSKTVNF